MKTCSESIILTVKFKILDYYPYKANWDITWKFKT